MYCLPIIVVSAVLISAAVDLTVIGVASCAPKVTRPSNLPSTTIKPLQSYCENGICHHTTNAFRAFYFEPQLKTVSGLKLNCVEINNTAFDCSTYFHTGDGCNCTKSYPIVKREDTCNNETGYKYEIGNLIVLCSNLGLVNSGVTTFWTSHVINKGRVPYNLTRPSKYDGAFFNFNPDKLYQKDSWDRGHITPFGDFKDVSDKIITNLYLNVAPQSAPVNRGIWKAVEQRFRKYYNNSRVYTGTLGSQGQLKDKINIPKYFWKTTVSTSLEKRLVSVVFNGNFSINEYQNDFPNCELKDVKAVKEIVCNATDFCMNAYELGLNVSEILIP